MTLHLINTSAVRQTFLDRVPVVRAGTVWHPTRVSQSALDFVEASVLRTIDQIIAQHPTKGKTITA